MEQDNKETSIFPVLFLPNIHTNAHNGHGNDSLFSDLCKKSNSRDATKLPKRNEGIDPQRNPVVLSALPLLFCAILLP